MGTSSNTLNGINLVSFSNTPQANSDTYTYTEGDFGSVLLLDVMSNDLGGSAKTLYSVDDGLETSASEILKDLAVSDVTVVNGQENYTALGAKLSIYNGQVKVEFSQSYMETVNALANGQTMVDSFVYAIRLGNGTLAWARAEFKITGTNDAPVAAVDMNAGFEDSVITGSVATNDTDADNGAVLTYSLDAAVAGLTLNGDGSYSFNAGDAAYQHLAQGANINVVASYTVTDQFGASSTSTLTITLTGTNDAPEVSGVVSGTATEDGALRTLDALANASDKDDAATLSVVNLPGSLPAGVTFNAGTHSFTLDPANAAYQSLAAGATTTVTVNYGVSDGIATTPASVNWTVTGTNDGPVLSVITQPATVPEALDAHAQDLAPITGTLSVLDADVGDTLTPLLLGNPAGSPQVFLGTSLYTLPASAQALVTNALTFGAPVTSDGGAKTISWTYDPQAANLDFLREGQVLTVRYVIQVGDGTAGSTPRLLEIKITGTNDGPTITAGTVDHVDFTEDTNLVQVQSVNWLMATGQVLFNDVDVGDTHSALFTKTSGSLSGSQFQLVSPVTEPTGNAGGAASWTYRVPSSSTQFLAEGQQVTETFDVTIMDAAGATVVQTITVTVTGTNDVPVVGATPSGGSVIEMASPAGNLTTTGTFTFTDIDRLDTHTVSIATPAEGTLGTLSASVTTDSTSGATGVVTWNYSVPASAVEYLAVGQPKAETFTVNLVDGHTGGTVQKTVTVTIVGTNDAPDISVQTGDSDAAGVTEGDAGLQASGHLSVTDVDVANTVTVVVDSVSVGGTFDGANPLSNAALKACMSLGNATANLAEPGSSNNLSWTFNSGSQAFDFLGEGKTLELMYTLKATDSSLPPAFDNQTVTIIIAGTNDAPVLSAIVAPPSQAEAGDAHAQDIAPITGILAVADKDVGDTLQASIVGSPVVRLDGAAFALPGDAQALVANALSLAGTVVSDGGNKTIGWTYDPAAANLDFLRAGQVLTLTYAVKVSDGLADSGTQNVVITITGTNDAPEVSGAVLGAATEDSAASTLDALANATDKDAGTTLSVVDVPAGLPSGVTYDAPTHSFTLDPGHQAYQSLAAGVSTTVTVSYGVSDGIATTSASVQWTVTGTNDAPDVTGAVLGDALEDGASITLNALASAVDADAGDTLSVVGLPGTLPDGVSYDTASHSFSLFPGTATFPSLAAGATTSVTVTYGVTDGTATTPASVTWTITGTNDAPVITSSAQSGDVKEDGPTTASGQVTSSDVDNGATATYTGSTSSVYGSFAVVASTGEWTYTLDNPNHQSLAQGEIHTENFTVTVSDSKGGTASQDVLITITGTNDAPVVSGAVTGTATEDGASSTLSALANASDVDNGTTLSVVNLPGTLPAGVTFNASTNSLTLDPANSAFQTLAAGNSTTVTVTYGVSDGIATTPASVSWTVTGTNDAPVVSGPMTGTATEDGAISSLDALAHASDPDAGTTLTVAPATGSLPAGVTYDPATHSFLLDPHAQSYQPLAQGESITVGFNYGVTDGTVTTSTSMSWTITGTNDAPVANADSTSTAEDETITGSVAGNDSDIDHGAVLTYSLNVPVAGLTLNPDGSYTFDSHHADYQHLADGDSLNVVANYTVTDEHGATGTSTLTIALTGRNDVPVVTGVVTGTATEDGAASTLNALANASDIDDSTTLSVVNLPGSLPAGVTYNAASHSFTLDPTNAAYQSLAAGATTTVTVNYGVFDGTLTVPAGATWTVTGVNDVPIIAGVTSGSVTEDTAVAGGNLAAAGSLTIVDADQGQSTFTAINGVAGSSGLGSFTLDAAGHWTYSANNAQVAIQQLNAGQTLTDWFTAVSSDGSASQVVTVTINGVNDAQPPVATDDVLLVSNNTSIRIAVAALMANDLNIDSTVTVTGVSIVDLGNIAAGSLQLTTDGYVTFQQNGTTSGLETFSYSLSNGDTGLVSVKVVQTAGNTDTFDLDSMQSSGLIPSYDVSYIDLKNGVDFADATGTTSTTSSATINYLIGAGNTDTLIGSAGSDRIDGGAAADVLTGGGGADTFVFRDPLGSVASPVVDTISDFDASEGSGQDTIDLYSSVFANLATTSGTLDASHFASVSSMSGSTASGAQIVYNTTTGGLFYDGDGGNLANAIQFATLTTKPPGVDATDFHVTIG